MKELFKIKIPFEGEIVRIINDSPMGGEKIEGHRIENLKLPKHYGRKGIELYGKTFFQDTNNLSLYVNEKKSAKKMSPSDLKTLRESSLNSNISFEAEASVFEDTADGDTRIFINLSDVLLSSIKKVVSKRKPLLHKMPYNDYDNLCHLKYRLKQLPAEDVYKLSTAAYALYNVPEDLLDDYGNINIVLLQNTTLWDFEDIVEGLHTLEEFDGVECYLDL